MVQDVHVLVVMCNALRGKPWYAPHSYGNLESHEGPPSLIGTPDCTAL